MSAAEPPDSPFPVPSPSLDREDNAEEGAEDKADMEEANQKMLDFFQSLPKGFFKSRPLLQPDQDIVAC